MRCDAFICVYPNRTTIDRSIDRRYFISRPRATRQTRYFVFVFFLVVVISIFQNYNICFYFITSHFSYKISFAFLLPRIYFIFFFLVCVFWLDLMIMNLAFDVVSLFGLVFYSLYLVVVFAWLFLFFLYLLVNVFLSALWVGPYQGMRHYWLKALECELNQLGL